MNTSTPPAERDQELERRRFGILPFSPQEKTTALAIAILLAALPLVFSLPDATLAARESSITLAAMLCVAFVMSERLVFHIEARNEAVSFSPTDIPLAIGLVLLSPVALVAVRLAGAFGGLVVWRRQPLFKLAFNLASFTTETVVGIVVFRSLAGHASLVSPRVWLALVVAMGTALITGGVLIAIAISFFEGDFGPRVRKEFTHSYLFYLPGATVGASAAVSLLVDPWLALVFLAPAPAVWLVLRSHGSLMHRYTDLSSIHAFSSHVGRSTHLDDVADTAADQIAGHLRAAKVALAIWDRSGRVVRAAHGDRNLLDALPVSGSDPVWAAAWAYEQLVVDERSASGPIAQRLREHGVRHAVVVPLVDDGSAIGVLVVADRQGASDRFDSDDLDRLQSITHQLVLALRKGQLHVEIQHDATHDRLTDLPNRSYLEAFAGQVLATEEQDGHALLMIDLDRFKEVNDTLGHQAGDELLIQVADRLRDCIAENDVPARFGGDEFAVFVPNVGPDEASLLAEVISQELERPFAVRGSNVAIAASVGIAVSPDHGRDCGTLLRRADLAMYEAKRRHDRSLAFHDALESNDSVRLEMLGDLRAALQNGEVIVHFQPKIDVRTNDLVSVEALARWHHPTKGWISPDTFIGLAEQAGLIEELTRLVLNCSLRAVSHWDRRGHRIGVAVNLSTQSLLNADLPRTVSECLRNAGVSAKRLTLEITETTMMGDAPGALRILTDLDRIGVRISVDDFGTGYSSLVNLRNLPIAELKIDRRFVSDMLADSSDEVIVRSTIDLAHNLGLTVVAEGVESDEVFEVLRVMGCDLAQGFGICRPLSVEHFDAWLGIPGSGPLPDGVTRRSVSDLGSGV